MPILINSLQCREGDGRCDLLMGGQGSQLCCPSPSSQTSAQLLGEQRGTSAVAEVMRWLSPHQGGQLESQQGDQNKLSPKLEQVK